MSNIVDNDPDEPMKPSLTDEQEHDLLALLNTPTDGPPRSPTDIVNQIRDWADGQQNVDVDAWFAAEYPHLTQQRDSSAVQPPEPQNAAKLPSNSPAAAPRSESTGHQFASHMNSLKARDLSFAQAAALGVELVHHPDSNNHQIFHTAGGDIIYFDETTAQWDVVEQGRVGQAIKSGNMDRIHIAYIAKDAVIADTAMIAETATVEPGARIGPYAKVGKHAHVGAGAIVASYVRVEDGAFVGAFSSVRDGSRLGPGAVLGAGSRVGASTNIGAGARLEQRTEIGAFDNVAANSRVGGSSTKDRSAGSKLHPQQISQLVDKLAALDRD
jgi:hypothetical protein